MQAPDSPTAADLDAIVAFVLEIDRLKGVERKTRPLGLARLENSAEHSWQIALMAQQLAPFAPPGTDIARVVAMLLVHDLGEIDTGDVLVYAEHAWAEHKAAEQAAVQRIFGLLPPAQAAECLALWLEFEAGETPSARFANAADRAMPVLLNLANQGQSWREHGIGHARVVARIRGQIEAGCPALWAHLEQRLARAQSEGWFGVGA